MEFPAAPAHVQALYGSNVGALYSHTCVPSYTYHSWNICGKFKNRRRRASFRFQRRALGRAEINFFLPKSDKFSHQVAPCNNCDIKNGGKTSEEIWSTLAASDSAIFGMYINCCYFCVRVRPKNLLSLSFFFLSLFRDEN